MAKLSILLDPEDEYLRASLVLSSGYPALQLNGSSVYLHRLLMSCPNHLYVDHIDRNILNAQKVNLRICTQSQNMMNSAMRSDNTSGYKGVAYFPRDKNYRAYINKNGKQFHIGYFDLPETAALAYNRWAKILHGEYANLNKVDENETN